MPCRCRKTRCVDGRCGCKKNTVFCDETCKCSSCCNQEQVAADLRSIEILNNDEWAEHLNNRKSCIFCGRMFIVERVQIHQKICGALRERK